MSKLPDVSKAQRPLESCYAHWFHFHEGGLWLNRMATFQEGKSELITSYALLRRDPPRLNEESKMINDIPVKRIYGDLTGKVSSPEMNTYDFSKRRGVCEKIFFFCKWQNVIFRWATQVFSLLYLLPTLYPDTGIHGELRTFCAVWDFIGHMLRWLKI